MSHKPRSPLRLSIDLAQKTGMGILSQRRNNLSPSNRAAVSQSSTDHIPLPAYLKKSSADITNTYVELEWLQRDRLAAGLEPAEPPSPYKRINGDDAQITARNRYTNVEPFDLNRIRLKAVDGGNDYINASAIILGRRRYVSTQGPKKSSVPDFYRMVAEQTGDTAVVVMLTQTYEAGKEKCYPYFPTDTQAPLHIQDDPDNFEAKVTLMSVNEDQSTRSTIRCLKLETRQDTVEESWREQEVWHLLFCGWPDFLVPEGDDRQALINLIYLSRKLNSDAGTPRHTSFPLSAVDTAHPGDREFNPRIVHCSAGVGRTGTFIALDHLLTLLDDGTLDQSSSPTVDPISDTVDKLRQQRMMMVQGPPQFAFIYDVMKEMWVKRWESSHS